LLLTPIQIGRNVVSMSHPPEPSKPSAQLEKLVRMTMAGQAIQQQVVRAQSAQAVSAKAY
jgi:hypothetical protein